ncbi:MAG TPA: family 1 glycosylhydrolase, partial [Thermoanaerobaculia bacterium]|nr:family 1 glycosylhydrolase [Thermoanaerobaculia bacterium]
FDRDNLWTRTGSVELFARFARVVGQALGDRARVYTLLNEPLVFLLAGFIDAQIPPGVANPRDARKALDHLLAAHVAGAQALREVNPGVAIGVAHNMMGFAPLRRRNLFDRMLSRMAGWFYNEGLWEAFATGKWNLFLPPATWFRGSRPDLVGSIDFAGVNFYSRLHLRFPGRERWYGDFTYLDRSGRGLTDNGWEIVPELLEPMLLTASSLGLPVMVTENGLADARDQIRGQFLSDHLEAIERAALRGVSVAGYFHWSLLDNYEWLDGFGPRFGLYDLDPSTLVRTARPSVRTFRDLGRRFLAGSLTP